MKKGKKTIALLLLALFVVQAAILCGCAAKSASKASGAAAGTAVAGSNGVAQKSADAGTAASTASASKAAESARKIIRSANLVIQTLHYEKSAADFEKVVETYGGYIQDSSTQGKGIGGGDANRSALYTVRIPSEKLNDFLNSAGSIGSVVTKTVSGQDVSQNYYDTQTRLKTLQTEQARILEIMGKATQIADVLTIEQRLSEVENQIEQLTGELQKWDSLTELSTVSVRINEVGAIAPAGKDFGTQIVSVFRGSVSALGIALRVIVLILIAILPFAVIALVVLAIIFAVRRYRRRRNPPMPKAKEDGARKQEKTE